MEQKAPRNVSWCYALNNYAERFNVEKMSDEVRVNWKGVVPRQCKCLTRRLRGRNCVQSTRRAGELFRAHRTSLKLQFES